ncbi:MAG: ribonuclease Z [Syntrophobacterales bacterium]|nr:ribonuclease Z [Syntrophobacterales bacterium]
MKIVFLGTNGWYDTETGNTLSTLVQTESFDIIFDAGNGIQRADRYLSGDKPVFIFISHFHLDHVAGLHILGRFNLREKLTICGPKHSRQILDTFLNAPFTMPLAQLPFPSGVMEMPEDSSSLPFLVQALPLRHSSLTLGYRIEVDGMAISHCSDTGYCENAVSLGNQADLLITECAFKTGQANEAWPHLNPETAARIAAEARTKRLALTHFDAFLYQTLEERTEARRTAAAIFPQTIAATDGMEITI